MISKRAKMMRTLNKHEATVRILGTNTVEVSVRKPESGRFTLRSVRGAPRAVLEDIHSVDVYSNAYVELIRRVSSFFLGKLFPEQPLHNETWLRRELDINRRVYGVITSFVGKTRPLAIFHQGIVVLPPVFDGDFSREDAFLIRMWKDTRCDDRVSLMYRPDGQIHYKSGMRMLEAIVRFFASTDYNKLPPSEKELWLKRNLPVVIYKERIDQ